MAFTQFNTARCQWLSDIWERILEQPKWWLDGVPRYCDYDPGLLTGTSLQALVLINCIGCNEQFSAAYCFSNCDEDTVSESHFHELLLYYKDQPPQHYDKRFGYACAGNSASVEIETVLQVWQRRQCDWVRLTALEDECEAIHKRHWREPL